MSDSPAPSETTGIQPRFCVDGRVLVGNRRVGMLVCERDLPAPNWRLRMDCDREASWHYLRRDGKKAAMEAINGKRS